MDNSHPDERTPLLNDCAQTEETKKAPTPLPKFQLAIVLLLQICEPITSQSIYPYINQLISELDIIGGDKKKVGYYAGLIESLFFATEALTVFQWSRISDHIGRKPVILFGLFGTVISILSFGMSRTFWALVVSRCLVGLLNGNVGVMKSVMGELTDPTNRADGFALLPITWCFGATVGPLLGGSLSRPHERFPSIFGGTFWKEYPYFLPCLVTASYVLLAFLITLFFFKETLKKRQQSQDVCGGPENNEESIPFRKLLVHYPLAISVSNYVILSFLSIALYALLPLFFSMPIEVGGLDLDPPKIGYIIGAYGAASVIFQALFFARIVRYFGAGKAFLNSMSTLVPIILLFPTINTAAVAFGTQSPLVWALIATLICCMIFFDFGYGIIFMFVTASAPNKRSLGATNGLAQTTVSFARALGPAFSTSLFAFSVQHNILGGFGVYAFFLMISVGAIFLASRLPGKLWDEDEA